ncbi:MAG: biotin--protein ligase [Candidatus Micrarchaeota archaeon]
MRCEEKVKDGKLVCIEIRAEGGKAFGVRITGDFFLHPEDAIEDVEKALSGMSLGSTEGEIAGAVDGALSRRGAQLIGASAADIARIFKRAVSG